MPLQTIDTTNTAFLCIIHIYIKNNGYLLKIQQTDIPSALTVSLIHEETEASDSDTEYDTQAVLTRTNENPSLHQTRFFDLKVFSGHIRDTNKTVGEFTLSKMITPAYKEKRRYQSPPPVYFLSKFRIKQEFRGMRDPITQEKYSQALFSHVIAIAVDDQIPLCLRPSNNRSRAFYLKEINRHYKTHFTPKAPQIAQPKYPNFFSITDPGIPGGYAWRFNLHHTPIEEQHDVYQQESCSIS